jgi:hypothetical protein
MAGRLFLPRPPGSKIAAALIFHEEFVLEKPARVVVCGGHEHAIRE